MVERDQLECRLRTLRERGQMKIHTLRQEQTLPILIEEAWDFFSSPANLDAITPPDLGFEITCP